MNFLAHALLAGDDEDWIIGQASGDFVKRAGLERLPERVRAGVRMHQRLDAFADYHPIGLRGRRRLEPPFRRWGGVLLDLYGDHFLAGEWESFRSDVSLEEFTADFYALLKKREADLPEGLRRVLPSMVERDWLGSYRSIEGIERAMAGVARRARAGNPLARGGEPLRARYEDFRGDFLEFFPEAVRFAADLRFGEQNAVSGVSSSADRHGDSRRRDATGSHI